MSLIEAIDANSHKVYLYGTTAQRGGSFNVGAVYKMTPSGAVSTVPMALAPCSK